MPSDRNRVEYVFLDRDGVINRKMPEGRFVTCPAECVLYPGAATAIAALNRAGMKVIVVTNQRGVALGLYSEEQLAEIHERLRQEVARGDGRIDAIYYCPHERGTCDCRKPAPGLFWRAFLDFPGAAPENSLMIGDSLSDVEAARNLGMASVFIDGDPHTQPPGSETARGLATFTALSLAAFVSDFVEGPLSRNP